MNQVTGIIEYRDFGVILRNLNGEFIISKFYIGMFLFIFGYIPFYAKS
jgi:hypothetical protein